MQVPQFAEYGQLFKSSAAVQLTEEETEYNIVVVKHVFPNHTVLQFQCTNTVQEQVLEDVSVSVDLSDAVQRRHDCHTWPCEQQMFILHVHHMLVHPMGCATTMSHAVICNLTYAVQLGMQTFTPCMTHSSNRLQAILSHRTPCPVLLPSPC